MYARIIVIDVRSSFLEDCAEVRAGYPFRGAIDEVPDGGIRVVQMKDVDPTGTVQWAATIRTDIASRKAPDWLEPGDILFVSRGNRFYAVCLDPPPFAAVCSPHFFHLKVRPAAGVLPRFLAWQLNQPPLQRKLQAAAEGSSQLSIRRPELEALPISVPSIDHQQRIVQLIDAARHERALLQALIRNREQHLEAIASGLSQTIGTAEHPAQHTP